MQSIGSYRADAAGWAADECCFQRKRLNLAFAVKGIWKGDVVICFVCVRGELIALPRSKYMERYFGCSFFTTFFLREKESGGKKSAYKGDCAAIRFAPIRRSRKNCYAILTHELRSCAAHYVSPPMTAQPIATWQAIVRNARQVLCLAFLILRMHV